MLRELDIAGCWVHEPEVLPDSRGTFHEWFRDDAFRTRVGRDLRIAQVNSSVSRRGALRGIHFTDAPPGQAKFVSCVRGAVHDVVVDVRRGSPTYGQWRAVRLDDRDHRAVYLGEGLGHAFMALTDDATMIYLCSETYAPQHERVVHPLDTRIGIDWPRGLRPVLSDKDAAAPTLAEAEQQGLLPAYADCAPYHVS
uniref:dTDP-4-dehydrorhamnose 3,5-epimerase n=1 Tax=Streptomyces versipellis TaxID=67375 RepID=A0A0B6VRF3_9ACTN|nr:putative TDP-sugar 3,5-epimerase [Streptomyces versipellis]